MTNKEVMALGWVWGRVYKALGAWSDYDPAGTKYKMAAMRPISGMTQILTTARHEGVLTDAIHREIAEALDVIAFDDEMATAKSEVVQPLDMQGSWQIGCERGKAGKPWTQGD